MIGCCMNPMMLPHDYEKDFRFEQLKIQNDFIEVKRENNICKNNIKSFKSYLTTFIHRTHWNCVEVRGITQYHLHEFLRMLSSYSMSQIILNSSNNETVEDIQTRLFNLFKRKNSDYGNSFEVFGKMGIIIRLIDKMNRLITLLDVNYSKKVNDEGIKDTWEDLYNYTILAIISE